MVVTPDDQRREHDRVARLEAFVGDVVDIAETLQILGAQWGDARGEALRAYAKQLEERAQKVLSRAQTD